MAVDVTPVRFTDGVLRILDQTRLPGEEIWIEPANLEDIWQAIKRLQVRGAPAIGVAAACGIAQCAAAYEEEEGSSFFSRLKTDAAYLVSARPTAVNLAWALARMERCAGERLPDGVAAVKIALRAEAEAIRQEDEDACRAIGEHGLTLLRPGMGILTHCNAGALATARYGTALSPLYLGQERGYGFRVFADETRPLLQGARLTAWELDRAGIDVTLICDNMASLVMKKGWVDAVLVGCDRMAANGDGANKIGTSALAILAKEYGIPFYMFVPASTIDLATPTGADIVIEEREGREITDLWYERPMAPAGVKTFNPAFDVTDAAHITAVVTERGIARPPYAESLARLLRTDPIK